MKLMATHIAAGVLLLAGATAQAGGAMYDIEVKGLQGISLGQGESVFQPEPVYPRMALRRGLTGEVLVQYSVNTEGKAENIQILESSPRGFFDGATLRILESTTFSRGYNQGEPATTTGITKRFVYEITRDAAGNDQLALNLR